LLWVTLHTASGPAAGTHFVAYDGNGNIVALSAASDGSGAARYEYGPFGESIRITGPAANQNPFRFSTKRTDSTTDLVVYEYRAYNPILGRWLSRDPIGERGGRQLHGFVRNAPTISIDLLGLFGPIHPLPPGWPPNQKVPRPNPRPYPPQTPFPQRLLQKYDCSCCGQKEIADGKAELISRFNLAKAYLDTQGLRPDAEADEPGEASCDTANGAVLNFINPTPRCWICFMDRRWGRGWPIRWDENFIHCYTVNNVGIHDELILDWFDSAIHNNSGVYIDVTEYYRRYPDPAEQYPNAPIYADCSKPSNMWTPDYTKFEFLFDKNRNDPPVNR
jgi:RHS repeat-associated protein